MKRNIYIRNPIRQARPQRSLFWTMEFLTKSATRQIWVRREQTVCTLTIDGTAYDLAEYIQMHAPVADAFYVTDLVENIGTPEEDDGLEIAVRMKEQMASERLIFSNRDGDLTIWGEVGGFPFRDRNARIAVLTARAV